MMGNQPVMLEASCWNQAWCFGLKKDSYGRSLPE
jgi:hypothetical protein